MHKVNLLPPAAIQRFRQQRLWNAWRKIILLTTLMTGSAIVWGQSTAVQKNSQQAARVALAQHPRQIRDECRELKTQLRDLQAYEAQQRNARGQHSPLVTIAMLHRLKQELGGQLQVKSLGFVDRVATQPAGTPDPASGHVDLQLISAGSASCSRVMQLLQDTGYFSDVILSSSLEKVEADSDMLQFSLRCDF